MYILHLVYGKLSQSVEKRTGPFTRADCKQMMLSDITQNGMKITGIYCSHSRYLCTFTPVVHSFLELIPIIFKIPGFVCFMTEKLSQDPLERFFGCQRQQGKTNDNPKVHEFLSNTQLLRVIDSINVHKSLKTAVVPKENIMM